MRHRLMLMVLKCPHLSCYYNFHVNFIWISCHVFTFIENMCYFFHCWTLNWDFSLWSYHSNPHLTIVQSFLAKHLWKKLFQLPYYVIHFNTVINEMLHIVPYTWSIGHVSFGANNNGVQRRWRPLWRGWVDKQTGMGRMLGGGWWWRGPLPASQSTSSWWGWVLLGGHHLGRRLCYFLVTVWLWQS